MAHEFTVEQRLLWDRLKEGLYMVPNHMWQGIQNYFVLRVPPGGFFYAVLTNNLKEAAIHADGVNRLYLYQWVQFLMEYAPSESWGSQENVKNWLEGAK